MPEIKFITKNELKVFQGNLKEINYGKNKNLNKIKKQIPDGIQIKFNDLNKNGYVDAGEIFSYTEGDKEICYYSIKNGDSLWTIKRDLKIKDENIPNSGTIIRADDFLKYIIPAKKTENENIAIEKPIAIKTNEPNEVSQKESKKPDFLSQLKYPKYLNKNPHFKDFIKSLEDNKESLKKDLNLSEEEYIELVQISLAIIEAETKSGLSKKMDANVRAYTKLGILKTENYIKEISAKVFSLKRKTEKTYEPPSLGISNLKMSNFNTSAYKNLLSKYNISYDKELGLSPDVEKNDKKAAIATIIRLKEIKDDYYNTYLNNFKETKKPEDRKVSLEEYIPIRWKGTYVLEKGKTQKVATKNIELIKDFRKNPDKYIDKDLFLYILQIHNNNMENKDHKEVRQKSIQEIIIKAGR